jgi:CheY-like chemotaxis protein
MNAVRKVLLVEDEVLVAALAVDALEELGYQTIESTTAKGARELARDAQFAFAVIDVGLPDGRGDALALELRNAQSDLPIVIATGYDGAHVDEQLRAQPRTAVLSKPYDIGQMRTAIQSIL